MPSVLGFTVVQYGAAELTTYTVPGTSVRLSVRREVAPLLIGLAADYHRTVEPLNPKSCWGHAPRKIGGGNVWSRHAPGIAVDLNATAHPQGKRDTFTAAEKRAVRALLEKYSYKGRRLFRWGGDYKSAQPDEMHWELNQERGLVLDAVKALQAPAKPVTPTKPKPTPGRPAPGPALPFPLPGGWYFGPKGGPNSSVSGYHGRTFKGHPDRWWLQQFANQLARRGWSVGKGKTWLRRYGNDGRWGGEYEALVKAFQKDQRLHGDGKLGAATWGAAFRNPVR